MITQMALRTAQVVAVGTTLLLAVPAGAADPQHSASGKAAAWRTPLGAGAGAGGLEVVGGLLVARGARGEVASYDLETGRRRAVLVPGARSCCDSPGRDCRGVQTLDWDPRAGRNAVLHGALLALEDAAASATDLQTGRTLWRTPIPGFDAEHDTLEPCTGGSQLVQAGSLDVIGFLHGRPDRSRAAGPYPVRTAESEVLAVDPSSGEVRWQKVVLRGASADVRIVGCGDLVLVWREGVNGPPTPTLTALEASSGRERWQVPLPDRPETPFPLVSCGGSGIAVASRAPYDDHSASFGQLLAAGFEPTLRWLDPGTGATLWSAPLPHGATHLSAGRGTVVVVLQDDAPRIPRAFLSEIAMPSGRTLWRRELPYSVVQLDADDTSVHALAGDGRLWSMTRGTGAPRWGLRAGTASSFALSTKAGLSRTRVVLQLPRELAAFEPAPGVVPLPMEPYLRLEFAEEPQGDGQPHCRSVAVSRLDGRERVLWTRELPRHARVEEPWPCWNADVGPYRRHPRTDRFFHLYDVVELGASILVANAGGVLGLDRASGRIRSTSGRRRSTRVASSARRSGKTGAGSRCPASGRARGRSGEAGSSSGARIAPSTSTERRPRSSPDGRRPSRPDGPTAAGARGGRPIPGSTGRRLGAGAGPARGVGRPRALRAGGHDGRRHPRGQAGSSSSRD